MNLISWVCSLCSSFCLQQGVFMRVAPQLPWCLNVNKNWMKLDPPHSFIPSEFETNHLKPSAMSFELGQNLLSPPPLTEPSQSFSRNLKHPETMSPFSQTFEGLLKLGGLTARLGSSKRAIRFLNIQESREMKVKIVRIKPRLNKYSPCFCWVHQSITGIPNLWQSAQKSTPNNHLEVLVHYRKIGISDSLCFLAIQPVEGSQQVASQENTNREHRNVIGNHWSHEIMSNPFIPQLSLHINQYKDSTGQLFKKISHNILHQKTPPCHWAALQF